MKLSPLLLGVSLGLNLALAAAFLLGRSSGPASRPAAAAPATAVVAAGTRAGAAAARNGTDTWESLKSDDINQEVARLREAGFPPSVLRAIITARIRAQFEPRIKALEPASNASLPPWKTPQRDPQYLAAQRALSQELDAAIKSALGPDANTGAAAATLRRDHPYLSDDKVDQIVAIRDRYNKQQSDFLNNLANASGSISLTRPESDKLRAMERGMQDEIDSILTPEEREEYGMRSNGPGSSVRSRTEAFDVTEQEFRALYRIELAYNNITGDSTGQPNTDGNQRAEASRVREESIKALFTPERYAEYQRAGNGDYRNTTRLVARLGLPATAANDVYAVQTELQTRSREASSKTRNVDELNPVLAALAAEAESRVTAIIGASGYQAYKSYGGSWMQNLAPRQPPPASRATPGAAAPVLRL